jgi:hypothetical protein
MTRTDLRAAILGVLLVLVFPGALRAQQPSPDDDGEQKRIFGVIPNFRTSPTLDDYQPLSSKQKFQVAADDSFDRGTFLLAAGFAAYGQLTIATPSFGHGVPGYARYYAASLSDLVIGDFMTEGIYPAILKQDPRYFRRGTGTAWSRLGYAMGQIVLTHGDSGKTQFNFSELAGNATAVGISNLYYPENHTLSGNVTKLGLQLGVDMTGNILKEFEPDVHRFFSRVSGRRQP